VIDQLEIGEGPTGCDVSTHRSLVAPVALGFT
jgi:hypothetical protein